MTNKSWLKNFINEDIYVFKETSASAKSDVNPLQPERDPEETLNTGKNSNSAAVILSSGDLEKHSELLTSILSTLDRNLENVDVLTARPSSSNAYLWILDFNNNADKKYTLVQDTCYSINSDSLSALQEDRNLKLALWVTIKELKNLQTAH